MSIEQPLGGPALVVDDSPDDRAWLTSLLAEAVRPARILQADSLAEATALLELHEVALVVADDRLPDGSGVALTAHARIRQRFTPVIVITGQDEPRRGELALSDGAADFLPKDDLTARSLRRAYEHSLVRARLEAQVQASSAAERKARLAAEHAVHEERKAHKRLLGLLELTTVLAAAQTTEKVLEAAMQNAHAFDGADAAAVYESRNSALCLVGAFGLSKDELLGWERIDCERATPVADVFRSRTEAIVEVKASHEPLTNGRHADATWVVLPLSSEGVTLGVLSLRFANESVPEGTWLAFVRLATVCLATAMRRAQLFERTQAAAAFEERLLAMVGHDLRTSLSAITLGTEALLSDEPEHPIYERLGRSARSMANLIQDILSRAALRRGEGKRRSRQLRDIRLVVSDQIDELRAAYPRSELKLCVDSVNDDPAICDAILVSQILTNLVRNAVQHGAQGAPVRVRCEVTSIDCTLSVHNEGTPIPPEHLTQLFHVFAPGRASHGTGLGLSIVKELVGSLGGEIHATSDDTGTTFTARLPLRPSGFQLERDDDGRAQAPRDLS